MGHGRSLNHYREIEIMEAYCMAVGTGGQGECPPPHILPTTKLKV